MLTAEKERECWDRSERAGDLARKTIKARESYLKAGGNPRAIRLFHLRKRADWLSYVSDLWARRAMGWDSWQ